MGINWEVQIGQLVQSAMACAKSIEVDTDKMCDHFREAIKADDTTLSNKTIMNRFSLWKKTNGVSTTKPSGLSAAAKKTTSEGPDDAAAAAAEGKVKAGRKRVKKTPVKPKGGKKAKIVKEDEEAVVKEDGESVVKEDEEKIRVVKEDDETTRVVKEDDETMGEYPVEDKAVKNETQVDVGGEEKESKAESQGEAHVGEEKDLAHHSGDDAMKEE